MICWVCEKEQAPESISHFCRTLNQLICLPCYRASQHDMYCGDPNVPLREYPTPALSQKLDRRCLNGGHDYHDVLESHNALLYCRRCATVKKLALDVTKQSELTSMAHDNENVLHFSVKHCLASTGHLYHHIQDQGRVVLYCRRCANLVHVSLD